MLKRVLLYVLITLLTIVIFSSTAFGASAQTVDGIDYTAELRSDGCAYVTEVWTVSFEGEYDGFSREITVPDENFEMFDELRDITVSVDGNICSVADADNALSGTYSLEKTEESYKIRWNISGENATHVFSLRYLKTGAVKLYDDRAYFYTTVVNSTDKYGICRDLTVSLKTQKRCFPEDFTVIESGSLAGKKSDSEIVFSADNSAGLVKVAVSLPQGVFDTQALAVIVDDTRAEIAVLVIGCVLVIALSVAGCFYCRNFRRIFRTKQEKKCRKKVYKEASYEAQAEVFRFISPARVMTLVSDSTLSGADRFIVTVLELVSRGYAELSGNSFSASFSSFSDSVKRPLDRFEKEVIELLGDEKAEKVLLRPARFYAVVQRMYKKIPFVTPSILFTVKGRKLVSLCFELKLSAKRHEFIAPEEISDDVFRNGKYSSADLLISLFNEYDLSSAKDFRKGDVDKFRNNLFFLRSIYDEGERAALEKELLRKMQKSKKHKLGKMVTDDGDDTQ